MKRIGSILIILVLFFTSFSFPTSSKVQSQQNPEDPNLAYPIETPVPNGDVATQGISGDSSIYAYPIEGIEPPAMSIPEEISEPIELEYPVPDSYDEPVSIVEPFIEVTPPQAYSSPHLKLTIEPSIYIPGNPLYLHWNIVDGDSLINSSTSKLSLQFSEGLAPTDEILNNQLLETGRVNLSIDNNIQGSIELIQTSDPLSNLGISAFLIADTEVLDATLVNIPIISNEALTNFIPIDQVNMIGDLATITSTDEAVNQNLIFASSQISPHQQPAYVLSKHAIEVVAVDKNTATNVSVFPNLLTLTIPYSNEELAPEQETDLQVFYYDENASDWFPMLTEVDTDAKTLTVQTDHLTVFDYKPANWQSYLPPFQDSFSIAEFTGAATYKMDFPTIAGTAGIQPIISLRYNSQVIDEGTLFNQASWVGMGW